MSDKILKIATEDLSKAMHYFSLYVKFAPKKRIKCNLYDKKTGQISKPNKNYSKELTHWKNEYLFPFFIQNGYDIKQLTDAWHKSIFKKGIKPSYEKL